MAVPANVATHFILIEAKIFVRRPGNRPFRQSCPGNGGELSSGIRPLCHDGPGAQWPNQRASPLWFPGSSRVAASPGHPAPVARCLPPRKSCIPERSEHRRLHWKGQPARRRGPALPARAASRCCVLRSVSATTQPIGSKADSARWTMHRANSGLV